MQIANLVGALTNSYSEVLVEKQKLTDENAELVKKNEGAEQERKRLLSELQELRKANETLK